jgi:hypothetical protein
MVVRATVAVMAPSYNLRSWRSTSVTSPVVEAMRPLNARSLVLSLLLGLDPPELSARALVRLAELFGIAPGTMRTALSRMAATGELAGDADGYRLVGRLLERKAAQDIGRRRRGAAGVPHPHGQRADGRAAARHLAAAGEPRRARR